MRLIKQSDEGEFKVLVSKEDAPEEWKNCSRVIAALFLGNDECDRSYCLVGAESPRYYRQIREGSQVENCDTQIYFIEELIGRYSNKFKGDLRTLLSKNMVGKVITLHSNEQAYKRIRRDVGFKSMNLKYIPRDDCSVVLHEWLNRKISDGAPAFKVRGSCEHFLTANYLPARVCAVSLLEFFDRKNKITKAVKKPKLTFGY